MTYRQLQRGACTQITSWSDGRPTGGDGAGRCPQPPPFFHIIFIMFYLLFMLWFFGGSAMIGRRLSRALPRLPTLYQPAAQ